MPRYSVGDCNQVIEIMDGWRVLDVGSGQAPHPRADLLVERYPHNHEHRSGDCVNIRDKRLLIADGAAMPFPNRAFDFAIASHVAEHVPDPVAFCRELTRVAKRGYLETPGWLGDMLLREEYHCWRVRRKANGLEFEAVRHPRPLGIVGDIFYAMLYADVPREGHRTLQSRGRVSRFVLLIIRKILGRLIVSPGIVNLMYTRLHWEGEFPVTIRAVDGSPVAEPPGDVVTQLD